MDTISILVGFLVGVVTAAIAVELGLKKLFMPPSATKVTGSWRLSEIRSPLVACTDAAKPIFDQGARIVTAGSANPQAFHGRTFRRNTGARANFMVHPNEDRALLFMGPIAPGTLALSTVDGALCDRLRAEHKRLWEQGEAYVEELPLEQVVQRHNVGVRTRGTVQEVVTYRQRHLMRLTDGRHVIGVLVDAPLDLEGKEVVVTGRIQRGTSGYPLLDADEVRVVRKGHGRTPQESYEPVAATPGPATEDPAATPGRTPAVQPRERPAPAPQERVLRVPARPPAPAEVPVEAPADAVPDEEEEAPVHTSDAERMRARARVVFHK